MKLRRIRKNYKKWEKRATTLQKWILENFEEELIYKKFIDNIVDKEEKKSDVDAWLRELDLDIVESS